MTGSTYRKNESENIRILAKTPITTFERFCINQKSTEEEKIEKFQGRMSQGKSDLGNICMVLDKFIYLLTKDYPAIVIRETEFFGAKLQNYQGGF